MLFTVCKHIRNFFIVKRIIGTYEIVDGKLDLPLLDGQYFLVEGSILNDGIYKYGDDMDLLDEKFDGTIVALAIPKEFISLVNEIEEYTKKMAEKDGFTSESFGGYSYTKESESEWQAVFSKRLNAWRKV